MNLTKRYPEFDFIRVISLLGILLCHSFFEFEGYNWIGRFLGLTFNFLFLILSAFLLGMKWEKDDHPSYTSSFFVKRVSKLMYSYYPYLVILFFFLYIINDSGFGIKHIISHILFLPWFDKLYGAGHLWFLTMITICYGACLLISKIKFTIRNKTLLYCTLSLGGVIAVVLDFWISEKNLPGYIFPYLWGYLMTFMFANKILNFIANYKPYLILCSIVIVISAIVFFKFDGFVNHNSEAYIVGMLSAFGVFTIFFRLLNNIKSNQIVTYLSLISFEVYLVHEFFLGRYSVYKLPYHPTANFIIFIILSICAGAILHMISTRLQSLKSKSK